MRHIIRGSLLVLASALLLGCNGSPKPNGEPPRTIEPAPPTLLSWPMWKHAKDPMSLVGTKLADVSLRDAAGNPWMLSRQAGKTVILQAGSASSPAYVRSLEAYARMAAHAGLEDVVHVTIYSEEAHPELITAGNRDLRWVLSHEDRAALAARDSYALAMSTSGGKQRVSGKRGAGQVVLVDYVDQTLRVENVWGLELGYGRGAAANPVVVVDGEGTVVFAASDLGEAMESLHDFLHEHLGLASHDVPMDEPVDDTPADEPMDDTPADEPMDDTPADEPADDTPADDTPADEPADDAPADQP